MDQPLRRGTEFRVRHYVLTPSGTAQDITGATFTANIRTGEGKDTTIVYTCTQTIGSLAGGIIDFSNTDLETLTFITGLDYWFSAWVTHPTWATVDRLELHGKLDIVG